MSERFSTVIIYIMDPFKLNFIWWSKAFHFLPKVSEFDSPSPKWAWWPQFFPFLPQGSHDLTVTNVLTNCERYKKHYTFNNIDQPLHWGNDTSPPVESQLHVHCSLYLHKLKQKWSHPYFRKPSGQHHKMCFQHTMSWKPTGQLSQSDFEVSMLTNAKSS